MSARQLVPVGLLVLALAVLAACAATKVRESWRDAAFQGRPKHVLVVAVAGSATVRRTIESGFANRLKESGAGATESFRILPEGVVPENEASREAVAAAIRERGIDAVLMARVAGRRSDQQYIPGMTIQTGFGYPYGHYGAGVSASVVTASSAPTAPTTQGYSHETKFLDVETQLFDVRTEKPVWAARTETRLQGAPQEEIKPYLELVTKELFQAKLF